MCYRCFSFKKSEKIHLMQKLFLAFHDTNHSNNVLHDRKKVIYLLFTQWLLIAHIAGKQLNLVFNTAVKNVVSYVGFTSGCPCEHACLRNI